MSLIPTNERNRGQLGSTSVFAAYGWDASISDEEILTRLLALNNERAAGSLIQ